jgi:uncharacterized protein YkuJ
MFLNRFAGFEHMKKTFIRNGLQVQSVSYYNKQRHMLVQTSEGYFYVVFKKQPIHSFNHLKETQRFLKDNPDMQGYGESINVDCIDYANSRNVRVVFYVYEDEKIYYIPLQKIRTQGMIRIQNKENEYKTLQEGSVMIQSINEREYIFPIKWMERYD